MTQLTQHNVFFIIFVMSYSFSDIKCNEMIIKPVSTTPTSIKCIVTFENDTKEIAYCETTGLETLLTLSPNTTNLTVTENSIAYFTKSCFTNFSNLKYLNLRYNGIKTITNEALRGLSGLEEIVLANNLILIVEKQLFEHCPRLKKVDFSNNLITQLSTFAFAMRSLRLMDEINFEGNVKLRNIYKDDFFHLKKTNLKSLNLSKCRLKLIRDGAFAPLKNLRHLSLSGNWLKLNTLNFALTDLSNKIERIDLASMKLKWLPITLLERLSRSRIQVLNFRGNPLKVITSGEIPFLPSLKKIDFSLCDLEWLEKNVSANLTGLEELDLSRNKMTSIPEAVYNLMNLKTLRLSGNYAILDYRTGFKLENNSFKRMKSLETLYLDNLHISTLNRYALNGLFNLSNLYIQNSLKDVQEFAFESLTNLNNLVLSNNEITNISKNVFFGLEKLSTLSLSHNSLNLHPDDDHFSHLRNLKTLDLSYNNINHIPRKDLSSLYYLENLMLSYNQIVPWKRETALSQDSNLKTLDLANNNLSTITSEMLLDFSSLENLDVSKNPFDCFDCAVYDFTRWITTTTTNIINNTFIECKSPKEYEGKTVVTRKLPEHCVFYEFPVGWVATGSVFIFVVAILSITGFHFRWYIRYYWFLTRVKVKRMKEIAQEDHFRFDAFISYNVNDRDWVVENMLPKLEGDEPKFNLCLHERDFVVGKEIWNNIVECIDNSRKIIIILSNNFLTSQWCTWEMNMAQFKLVDDNREALILIMLEDIEKKKMSSTLKYLIRTRTYLEWTDNVQGQRLFWERLKYVLQATKNRNENQTIL